MLPGGDGLFAAMFLTVWVGERVRREKEEMKGRDSWKSCSVPGGAETLKGMREKGVT